MEAAPSQQSNPHEDDTVIDTVALARQERKRQGPWEVECSYGGEVDLHRHLKACDKNPGHRKFIPIDQFSVDHIPLCCNNRNDLVDLVRAISDLTVCVTVKYVSEDRPETYPGSDEPYPCYKDRGSNFMRVGTGIVWRVKMFTSQGKCSCKLCCKSWKPETYFARIYICTAAHVVYDTLEGEHTTCHFFFDRGGTLQNSPNVVSLSGMSEVKSDTNQDWSRMIYKTHDLSLIKKLDKMVSLCTQLHTKVKNCAATSVSNYIKPKSQVHPDVQKVLTQSVFHVKRSSYNIETLSHQASTVTERPSHQGESVTKISTHQEKSFTETPSHQFWAFEETPLSQTMSDTESRNSEGRNSEGRNSEGRNSEGRNSEGRNSEGRNSEGRNSEGRNSEGRNSESSRLEASSSEAIMTPTAQIWSEMQTSTSQAEFRKATTILHSEFREVMKLQQAKSRKTKKILQEVSDLKKSHFLAASELVRVQFLAMPELERSQFLAASALERSQFLAMHALEISQLLEMSKLERSHNFLAASEERKLDFSLNELKWLTCFDVPDFVLSFVRAGSDLDMSLFSAGHDLQSSLYPMVSDIEMSLLQDEIDRKVPLLNEGSHEENTQILAACDVARSLLKAGCEIVRSWPPSEFDEINNVGQKECFLARSLLLAGSVIARSLLLAVYNVVRSLLVAASSTARSILLADGDTVSSLIQEGYATARSLFQAEYLSEISLCRIQSFIEKSVKQTKVYLSMSQFLTSYYRNMPLFRETPWLLLLSRSGIERSLHQVGSDIRTLLPNLIRYFTSTRSMHVFSIGFQPGHSDNIFRCLKKVLFVNRLMLKTPATDPFAVLTIIVSHPHGCSKQVSIGHYTKKSHKNNEGLHYSYTTATCPGSSGAYVFVLGRYWMEWIGLDLIHCGSCDGNNYSAPVLY